jgi:MFS family permease
MKPAESAFLPPRPPPPRPDFSAEAGFARHIAPAVVADGTTQPEPLRLRALGQFTALSLLTAFSIASHTSIVKEVGEVFSVSTEAVDGLTTVYFATFVVAGPLVIRTFHLVGLRMAMLSASVLNFTGAFMKLIAAFSGVFWLVVLGQVLQSLAQSFVLAGPTTVAAVWFLSDERTTATTVAMQADNIGIALMALVPPLIADGGGSTELTILYGVLFACSTAEMVFNFIAVPAAPVHASMARSYATEDEPDCGSAISALLRNTSYVIVCLGAALAVAAYWVHSVILVQILVPFGFSETGAGAISFSRTLLGIGPAFAIARFIDQRRQYRQPLVALMMAAVIALLCCLIALSTGTASHGDRTGVIFVFITHVLLAIIQSAIGPVAFEYVAELTYPQSGFWSAGVLCWVAHLVSTIFMALVPTMLPHGATWASGLGMLGFFAGITGAAALLVLAAPERLKRHSFELSLSRSNAAAAAGVLPPAPSLPRDDDDTREMAPVPSAEGGTTRYGSI